MRLNSVSNTELWHSLLLYKNEHSEMYFSCLPSFIHSNNGILAGVNTNLSNKCLFISISDALRYYNITITPIQLIEISELNTTKYGHMMIDFYDSEIRQYLYKLTLRLKQEGYLIYVYQQVNDSYRGQVDVEFNMINMFPNHILFPEMFLIQNMDVEDYLDNILDVTKYDLDCYKPIRIIQKGTYHFEALKIEHYNDRKFIFIDVSHSEDLKFLQKFKSHENIDVVTNLDVRNKYYEIIENIFSHNIQCMYDYELLELMKYIGNKENNMFS